MNEMRVARVVVCLFVAGVAGGCLGAPAVREPEDLVLRFDGPVWAIVNARRWDETRQNWQDDPKQMYFDAVHRFLLLRFPGCAETVHAKLREGYRMQSAALSMAWAGQDWAALKGYSSRQWVMTRAGLAPAHWHARAYALLRPWTDDADVGPTWNAYVNGAGWWRQGGGRCGGVDRSRKPLGTMGLWKEQADGRVDVTELLTSPEYGENTAERLRALEARGFLVLKDELSNPEYGKGLTTGVARIYVKQPRLEVVLRRAAPEDGQDIGELPPPVDVAELALKLKAAGGDGVPTTVVPENLAELAAALVEARRSRMPDWMWQRVEEVRKIAAGPGYDPWFQRMVHALDSGDRQQWLKTVDGILSRPPGWAQGHQRIEFSLPLYLYGPILPDVVHYHLRRDFVATLPQPLDPYSLWKMASMGTLNHMSNARPTYLLGAQTAGVTDVVEAAHFGLSLLNRQMIYSDGFSPEHGDSYYRGITMAPLQSAAKFADDPVIRLKASLMVEKLLFEDISIYHPGLRKRVSRISRRAGGLHRLVLGQDVPEAALHTLSPEGVLIHMEEGLKDEKVHDMRPFDLANTPPARGALMAPWGREWEANAVDRKPIPFRSVAAAHMFGDWLKEPLHVMTYMGENYALGSEELPAYSMVPFFAAWRRDARKVETVDDFSIMVLRGRLNEEPFGVMDKTPFGILQHNNKAIWVVKTQERKFVVEGHSNLAKGVKDGLTSFKAQAAIVAYGPDEGRELHVNGKRVTELPASARQRDIITIKDGVSYLGLIPLPATDMGRRQEVTIRAEHPFLTLDSYVMDREQPVLGDDDATWAKLADATGGWVVEFGDAAEHGSFEKFVAHMAKARTQARWDAEGRVLHLSYSSGDDVLEMGFRTDWAREVDLWHDQQSPSQVFAYQRVNGRRPWPDKGIEMDNPLGQLGTVEVLRKGGATLATLEGQMAFLRVEPVSGTYEGINPFIDPTPFELTTPEGVAIRSDGPLGLARVTVRPKENTLWVDYALLPASGDRGIEKLQQERPQWFPGGADVRTARGRSARSLLVSGLGKTPTVILNGERLPGPFPLFTVAGVPTLRIPIVRP